MGLMEFAKRRKAEFLDAKKDFEVGCEVLGMPRDPQSVKERGQRMAAGRRERERRATEEQRARPGHTFNVNGTNVQVATGDHSRQDMTVEQASDQLVLVIQGIVEMLKAAGATTGREAELANIQQAAVAEVTGNKGSTGGLRRFRDWAVDCAQRGGTASTVAAVTAACNGLLLDAEAVVRAIGH